MSFSMAPLLMHSPDLPAPIRDELRAAYALAPGQRAGHLATAACLMHAALAVDCPDALELVGLPPGGC
jgi:hypothetical protein